MEWQEIHEAFRGLFPSHYEDSTIYVETDTLAGVGVTLRVSIPIWGTKRIDYGWFKKEQQAKEHVLSEINKMKDRFEYYEDIFTNYQYRRRGE